MKAEVLPQCKLTFTPALEQLSLTLLVGEAVEVLVQPA